MKIEERNEGPAVVISPAGRLDAIGAPELEARIAAVARAGPGRVVMDCREVAYISSAGLRALLLGARACIQIGCEFSVAGLRPECRSILDTTGLLMVLDCPETVEEALAAPAAEDPREPEDGNGFAIAERQLERTVLLTVDGRLEGRNAPILTERIFAAVGRGSARIVLDCGGMGYVDSSGMRALLVSAKLCQEKGGRMVLAALLPECRSIIDMGGFTSVIDHFETREAALTALG
ncbi:MAG: STAS domain-containing protein [Alphaproteobacteria bacterium]|nr:STAS domain-containing protein [Alphaproteobacteria bacterium]